MHQIILSTTFLQVNPKRQSHCVSATSSCHMPQFSASLTSFKMRKHHCNFTSIEVTLFHYLSDVLIRNVIVYQNQISPIDKNSSKRLEEWMFHVHFDEFYFSKIKDDIVPSPHFFIRLLCYNFFLISDLP